MFTYLVMGIVTLAFIAVLAYVMFDKTKAKKLIAKLKKELKAKEEVKVAEEVKEEIVPKVVKEDVEVEETKTEETQPKKAKRPYKKNQKKQD